MKNKNVKAVRALVASVLLSAPLMSMANPDLASAKDCFSCHAVEDKVIGPAYKEVAEKYAGTQGADAMLIKKVMQGSSGTWGNYRMPANKQVNEAEARVLVEWVLSQNKTVSVK